MSTTTEVNNFWTTVSVTALPPGWVNVLELDNEPFFYVEPCPAVLVQERMDGGARETRAISAMFDEGGELIVLADNCAHYSTTTADQWARCRESAVSELVADRDNLKRAMLDKIAAAGDAGVPAQDLIPAHDRRALIVRSQLDGLVTRTWQADGAAIGGKVCIYRLAPS